MSYKTYQFHMPAAAISACITGFLQNGEQHTGLLNISGLLQVHCLNMGLGIWCNVVEMKRQIYNGFSACTFGHLRIKAIVCPILMQPFLLWFSLIWDLLLCRKFVAFRCEVKKHMASVLYARLGSGPSTLRTMNLRAVQNSYSLPWLPFKPSRLVDSWF